MGIVLGQPIPINNFLGTFNIPAQAIDDGVENVTFAFDGSTMTDPALRIALTLFQSDDAGQSWTQRVATDLVGGAFERNTLIPRAVYTLGGTFQAGVNRLVKGTAVVSGARLTSVLTITES